MTRRNYRFLKDGLALYRRGGNPYGLWFFDWDIPGWKEAPGSSMSSRPAFPLSYEEAKQMALRQVERHNPDGLDDLDFGEPDYEYDESQEEEWDGIIRLDYQFLKDGADIYRRGSTLSPYPGLWLFDPDMPGWTEVLKITPSAYTPHDEDLAQGLALWSACGNMSPLSFEEAKQMAISKIKSSNPEGLEGLDFGEPNYEYKG